MIINIKSAVSYVSPDKPEIETNFPAVKLLSAVLFLGINSTTLDGSCNRANLTTYSVVLYYIIYFHSIIVENFINN